MKTGSHIVRGAVTGAPTLGAGVVPEAACLSEWRVDTLLFSFHFLRVARNASALLPRPSVTASGNLAHKQERERERETERD